MWIKNGEKMFNLEHFDVVMQDKEMPEILWLVQMNPVHKTAIAKYDAEQISRIINEIARAIQNDDTLFILP